MVNALNDGLNKPDQVVINDNSSIVNTADLSALIQGGNVEPTAAAEKIVTFDPAFASVPTVTVTVAESGTGNCAVTSASAGSFGFIGTSGISYNWIALQ